MPTLKKNTLEMLLWNQNDVEVQKLKLNRNKNPKSNKIESKNKYKLSQNFTTINMCINNTKISLTEM